MIQNPLTGHAHPGDGVLLALYDHEPAESSETTEAMAHVEACPECQARLEQTRADAELFRAALAALPALPAPSFDVEALRRSLAARRPVAPRPPRWRRPAVLVAGALALATAAAASVGPIRSLIRRRNGPAPVLTRPRESSTSAPTSHPGTTISFAETGPDFTVRVDSVPARGDLEIDRGPGAEVSAQALTVGDDPGDPMVVLPHELRLRNGVGSTASYRIMIPGSVEHVRVLVAGRVLLDIPSRHARIALASGRQE